MHNLSEIHVPGLISLVTQTPVSKKAAFRTGRRLIIRQLGLLADPFRYAGNLRLKAVTMLSN
jgi:hypothetical protein